MRKISVITTLGLLLLLPMVVYGGVLVTGQVVDEDGAPQSEVKVEFFGENFYSAWTDDGGAFSISNVAEGKYKVKVTGTKQQTFDVKVGRSGMQPSRLVVEW